MSRKCLLIQVQLVQFLGLNSVHILKKEKKKQYIFSYMTRPPSVMQTAF